jgi:hypothetical protein
MIVCFFRSSNILPRAELLGALVTANSAENVKGLSFKEGGSVVGHRVVRGKVVVGLQRDGRCWR